MVARCTVEQLMPRLYLYGAMRGGNKYRMRLRDIASARPTDLVYYQLQADRPNKLWAANCTHASQPG